jgi:hypothetical protein
MCALIQEFPNTLGPTMLDVYLHHLASTGCATDDAKVLDELTGQLFTHEALTSLVCLKKESPFDLESMATTWRTPQWYHLLLPSQC